MSSLEYRRGVVLRLADDIRDDDEREPHRHEERDLVAPCDVLACARLLVVYVALSDVRVVAALHFHPQAAVQDVLARQRLDLALDEGNGHELARAELVLEAVVCVPAAYAGRDQDEQREQPW